MVRRRKRAGIVGVDLASFEVRLYDGSISVLVQEIGFDAECTGYALVLRIGRLLFELFVIAQQVKPEGDLARHNLLIEIQAPAGAAPAAKAQVEVSRIIEFGALAAGIDDARGTAFTKENRIRSA